MTTSKDVREEVKNSWRHCLRCKLADQRLAVDESKKKFPSEVPMMLPAPKESRIHFLYPCPDPEQATFGNVLGAPVGAPADARSHLLVEMTLGLLSEYLPWDPLEYVSYSFALGCRPTSFKDPRRVMLPKSQWMKACRPRWRAEVLAADPQLIVLCGRHAFTTVRPDLTKSFTSYIGEVILAPIPQYNPANGQTRITEYSAYVIPSPEEIHLASKASQFQIDDWDFRPRASHVGQPFHYWCWHVLYAFWLADTLMRTRSGEFPTLETSRWPDILTALESFYTERLGVKEMYDRLSKEIEAEITEGVRKRMQREEDGDDDDLLDEGEDDDDGDDLDEVQPPPDPDSLEG